MNRAEERDEPLEGMVAYALYKKSKLECVKQAIDEKKPLSSDQLKDFHKRYTNTMLESFENSAEQIVYKVCENYLEQRRDEIVREALGKMESSLLTRLGSATTFWKGFWPGFASSVAVWLVTAIIALAWAANNPDVVRIFLKAISPPVVENAQPAAPSR